MTIRNKQKRDIQDIIDKGGELASIPNDKPEWRMISFRITEQFLDDIEKHLKERPGMTRNAWLLEAVNEKLKKA